LEEIAKEVHKPIRRPKEFRKVNTYYPNDIWSADLVEMGGDMVKVNDGYKYILVVIDCYSRYAWVRKMKTKTAKETSENIKSVVEEAGALPNAFWVDEGKEFHNEMVKSVLKNVKIYSTFGEGKAAMVERLNRTLKNIMYFHFTVKQSRVWTNILDNITSEYNHKKHSITGYTPDEAGA
jgi:transposase InsO family protein